MLGGKPGEFRGKIVGQRVLTADGPRPTLEESTIQEIRRLRKQGKSLNQIGQQLGISHQTVANYAPQRRNGVEHR